MNTGNKQNLTHEDLKYIAREAALKGRVPDISSLSEEDVKSLILEFGVYQGELLAQNELLLDLRAELEESRDRYANLYERAPVGYMTLDRDGTVLQANLTVCDILEVYRSDLTGAPIYDYIDQANHGALRKALGETLAGQARTVEAALKPDNRGETRFIRLELRRAEEDAVKPGSCLAAVLDVTERVRLERALENSRLAAEAANKAKSEFLANMSHEIRTPMTGVLGMLELMERRGLDESMQRYVNTAKSSAEGLLTIINDILDLSKIEAGRMEIRERPFDLRRTMRGVADLFSNQAEEKGLVFETDVDKGLPERLRGDEARIRQIIFNLVGNALKFTDQGRISLRAREAGILNGGVVRIRFTVSDTGVGIPENRIKDVMRPFAQAESDYKKKIAGTGLGLAIVKRLVGLMRGTMSLTSTPGKGTTAVFTIPLAVAEEEAFEERVAAAEATDAGEGRRLKLLLAEDNPVNQLAASEYLRDAGHEVVVANDGREVLDLLGEDDFDLVLMDVQMPEMDGVEATKRIRAGETGADKNIPIIALTAYAMSEESEKFKEAGMDDHISKPMMYNDLAAKIQEVVQRTEDRRQRTDKNKK